MRLKIDLHVHTVNSPDAFTSLKAAAHAALARGLDGLAITDHECRTDLETLKLLAESILVLPGVEVNTGRHHILGIGVQSWQRKRYDTPGEAVERIHEVGGLAIVAHPCNPPFRFRSWRELREAHLDALEAVNSGVQLYSLGTRLASRAALALGLPRVGGSDSHIPATVGDAYTIVETELREPNNILDAIRQGRTEACGQPTTLKHRLEKLMLQLRRTKQGEK